jgi:prepilin-type processing-associated H-X9-DG protein
MRQLGLGLLGYMNAKNRFPNAGTIFDDPAIHQGDPAKSNLYRSIADPASFPRNSDCWLRSWVVELLPYLDNQELYDAWNRARGYLSSIVDAPGQPTNAQISATAIGLLGCPNDPTIVINQGNLSYVVNGGFARWPALPLSWIGSQADGQSQNGALLDWTPPGSPWEESQKVGQGLGVMFLGTQTGDQPWDIATRPSSISDGASTTLLLGENTLVGYSTGTVYSGGVPTNWACPLPNFTMFLGSDNVCQSPRSRTDCLGGQLAPTSEKDGPGWDMANRRGTFENINFARKLSVEGSFPFVNSGHDLGANFVFCDGSVRFIDSTIDGTVYAKLLTPAGEQLPSAMRQLPLSQADFPP